MAKYNFQISYAPSRPRSSRRTATAASVTSVAAAPAVDISGKLDKEEFYRFFEEVNIGTAEAPVYATRSKRGLFSDSFVSALGLNPNTGGGGGGGATALSELSDVQLSGLLTGDVLIYDGTHWVNRPQSSIVPDLSAYATREWVQQQGYATSAALTAHTGDTSLHVTSSERTLWNKTAADFAAIVGADSDQIINKWEEVVAFLDTYTEADTLANLLSNKVDKVTGYGLSKNDFTDALLSKLNGIEAGANRYVHPTGGADAAIDDAAGRVLAGITVNTLGHVTSVSSKTLAAADIPTLSISKVSGLQDALDGKLDAATFDDLFEKVNIGTTSAPKYAIRAKYGLYADGFLSAKGLNSSGGGGEGGATYDRLDAWSDYTADKAGWVLSAGLGYDLYSRVRSLEGGSALSFTTEGTGNVVTAVKKSGTAVVVTKGLTALTSHQPIYALNFQAGAFEAKKYTPNTGTQTVNIPTKTSHLSNDSGFITSAALTGYATQSWVKGLGYITASALTPYIIAATAEATFATKLGVSGNQIGTYVGGKLGNLITVPYAADSLYSDGCRDKDYHSYGSRRTTANVSFNGDAALHYFLATSSITDGSAEEGHILHCEWDNPEGKWLAQLLVPHTSSRGIKRRYKVTDTWTEWIDMLDASNFNQYSPSLTGDGASGSWNINAASATKLQTARTLWGQLFNGEENVSGDMTNVGSISSSGNISVTKAGTTSGQVSVANNNGKIALDCSMNRGVYDSTTSRWLIGTDGTNTFLMGGNVGLGMQRPAYKLDVAGVIHSTTGIFSDGYMSAKGINTASDVRLKRRIADVALTVRDVAEAPVYRFAWINGGGIDVGSTAQYWAAKVPELTHLLADGIHLGLDYGKAALLSVVAVARATADHERRIASLERQLLTQNAI